MTREKKLKPDLPSGFVDKKGSELILKDKLTEIIKKNFQLYGYEQISTPSFEFSSLCQQSSKFFSVAISTNFWVFQL